MSEMLIFALAVTLASVLTWLGAYYFRRRLIKQKVRVLSELNQLREKRWELRSSLGPFITGKAVEAGRVAEFAPSPELARQIHKQILARLAASHTLSKEDVRQEFDSQLAEVQTRLAEVESRFPKEAKLEKVTSMNDALLSNRIDQLAKQVDAQEKRILSKWDVALTVSTIIAGIAFVVAATYTVLKVVGGTAP